MRNDSDEPSFRAILLDESVDGIAVQIGRGIVVRENDTVEIFNGSEWEPALVTRVARRRTGQQLGLRWLRKFKEPPAAKSFAF